MTSIKVDRSVDLSQPLESLHDNEKLKAASNFLRGNIQEGLREPNTRAIPGEDPLLLKFHGIYQQDNRDDRVSRLKRKLEPSYQFMVRLRLPGGKCSVEQWQGLTEIVDRYAEGSIRITTRQTVQIHGVRKHKLQACMNAIGQLGLDTIAACGDDSRGVVCGINPALSSIHEQVVEISRNASARLIPKTSAYPEIWYGDTDAMKEVEEPVYGPLYLPRKFKVGFVIPPLNDVDIFAQDLGFIAIADNEKLLGFNVCVGGGMGQIDNRQDSYPKIAEVIGFVETDEVYDFAEIVMSIQRDYGDRKDRHRARFKYTLDRLGMDWFLATLAERRGKILQAAKKYEFISNGDQFGWQQGSDGLWHACLYIESGRIKSALKDRLQGFFQQYGGEIRLTANQNLVLTNIDEAEKKQIEWRLSDLGLDSLLYPTLQEVHSLACVGFPTCGLAMAESERYLPEFLELFGALKVKHGLESQPIKVRITGCPNGCARPYLSEIALTGRAAGKYNLYLGGGFHGQRLNTLYEKNLSTDSILQVLDDLLKQYKAEARDNEYFGDFIHRVKFDKPRQTGEIK